MTTKPRTWPVATRDCAEEMERNDGITEDLIRQAAITVAKTGDPTLIKAILDAQVPTSKNRRAMIALLSNDVDRARKILGI